MAVVRRGRLGEQRKEDLERFCDLLNSTVKSELRERLRELVKAWQDSGPNLEQMMCGSHKHLLAPLQAICAGDWTPTNGGRAILYAYHAVDRVAEIVGQDRVWRKAPDGADLLTPEAEAWIAFGSFTMNPHCEELAGPCARCGNYYVKKRSSQKVYCSRRCGNAATAVARTRERIASERRGKLARASAAMKKWESVATRQDWKHWVAKKTGIDPRFLTRAVAKGDLMPPKLEK
jgi:hypothetical protein